MCCPHEIDSIVGNIRTYYTSCIGTPATWQVIAQIVWPNFKYEIITIHNECDRNVDYEAAILPTIVTSPQ